MRMSPSTVLALSLALSAAGTLAQDTPNYDGVWTTRYAVRSACQFEARLTIEGDTGTWEGVSQGQATARRPLRGT